MKRLSYILLTTIIWLGSFAFAYGAYFSTVPNPTDTTHHEIKKAQQEKEKQDLKDSHSRANIRLSSVFATLKTEASFDVRNGILSATLSLEDNLGLPDTKSFFTSSLMYRFTPRSGLFMQYYGLNRSVTQTTDQEYYFLNDTIPAGTSGTAYFNTQVGSAGYLLSILKDSDAFLGAYFNVYMMFIKTGFDSDIGRLRSNVDFTAPFPSFGVVALFRITDWFHIGGEIGFFNLQLSTFGGNMYSFDIALDFKPVHWLGLTLSYQSFDIDVYFPSDKINSNVEYNFRGPALGLSFMF
jgi:hypothetical protein